MRYTANPDYDITKLIWSIFLTSNCVYRHTHTEKKQTSLKKFFLETFIKNEHVLLRSVR